MKINAKVEMPNNDIVLRPGQVWRRNAGSFKGDLFVAVRRFGEDGIYLIDAEGFGSSWSASPGFGSQGQEGFDFVGNLTLEAVS